MDKQIILIGGGVGKSMLGRALMALRLRSGVVTVADINDIEPENNWAQVQDGLPIKIPEFLNESMSMQPIFRRNKSDRKRNRANRWR
ncbi:hypothetical protein [Shewanella sp. MM_2022_3]|uniref:hypothetical protein n=1 Tax=Shewanella sp. MM_2022_3 TaxID=2923280 RepID=UPI001F4BFD2F|nr:hypothetical protein [Shewanella sp. MM_2022_3]MCH7421287.1 hypothetical protein [Shewanella sp. MM_2022_3]